MVEKYSKKAVEKAGQEGVKYIDKNGVPTEQQLDDAEAKAQQDYDNAKQKAEVCIFVYIASIWAHHPRRECGQSIVGV